MSSPQLHVSANLAMSADGKIAAAAGAQGRFTSPIDRAHMDMLRHDADAVLIGATTLRQANPCMRVKDAAAVQARLHSGRPRQPLAIVLSQSGNIPLTARMFADAATPAPGAAPSDPLPTLPPTLLPAPQPWVALGASCQPPEPERLGALARVLQLGAMAGEEAPSPLAPLVQALAQAGVRRLLVEGGGETLWHFAAAGLLHALHVTVAPCLLGGALAPSLLGGAGFAMAARRKLRLTAAVQQGDEMYLSYEVLPHQPA